MTYAHALSYPSWYSDGLRWIASLFTAAADGLDRLRGPAAVPLEPARQREIDAYLEEVRLRVHSQLW